MTQREAREQTDTPPLACSQCQKVIGPKVRFIHQETEDVFCYACYLAYEEPPDRI